MTEDGKDRRLSVKDTQPRPSIKGAYIFDQKQFKRGTAEEVRSMKDHAKRNPKHWPADRLARDIQHIREDRARLEKWAKRYSGKVPESWGYYWNDIIRDLENPEIKIDDAQVFAAIEYPHWQVQQALGMNRRLSPLQLNALALTRYHSIFTFEEVLTTQDQLGLDYQSVKFARLIFSAANDVMIEKAKLGIPVH